MVEIIKRVSQMEKSTPKNADNMQISLNSYGHIAFRWFHNSGPMPEDLDNVCAKCGKPIRYPYSSRYVEIEWHHVAERIPGPTEGSASNETWYDIVGADHPAEPKNPVRLLYPEETLITLTKAESQELVRFVQHDLANPSEPSNPTKPRW